MYKLFLDDGRNPIDVFYYSSKPIYKETDWVIVRNYDQFISTICVKGLPNMVSFDHDLADMHYENQGQEIDYSKYTEKTGYECAKWLVDHCIDHNLPFPNYYVHSWNQVGARNIVSYIENFKKHTNG